MSGVGGDWIARMASGDEAALEQLYEHFVSHVYGVALRIARDPHLAEEVVVDTFLQSWRTASRFDASRGKPVAWLLTIARSRALDALRRVDRADPVADAHDLVDTQQSKHDPDPADLADQLAASGRDEQLHAALSALSAVQRQLLSLAFFRGLTHSEIAAHVAMPLGTVKSHLRQGQIALRSLLVGEVQIPAAIPSQSPVTSPGETQ